MLRAKKGEGVFALLLRVGRLGVGACSGDTAGRTRALSHRHVQGGELCLGAREGRGPTARTKSPLLISKATWVNVCFLLGSGLELTHVLWAEVVLVNRR